MTTFFHRPARRSDKRVAASAILHVVRRRPALIGLAAMYIGAACCAATATAATAAVAVVMLIGFGTQLALVVRKQVLQQELAGHGGERRPLCRYQPARAPEFTNLAGNRPSVAVRDEPFDSVMSHRV